MQDTSKKFAITTKTDGNPEGKGVSGFMLDWHRSTPRRVRAKPQYQVLAELFTSMLALSANFKYQPVVGRSNYLYWIDEQWSLSLISPDEWSEERRSQFAGELVLQPDMTWTIAPAENLSGNDSVSSALREFYDNFVGTLDTDQTLDDILPYFVGSMPYWQRLYASALSRSLRATMSLGDQTSIGCREWGKCLPKSHNALLTGNL